MRPKLLYITTSAKIGGAEKLLVELVRRLKRSFDIQVCVLQEEGPISGELNKLGITTHHLNIIHKWQFWRSRDVTKIVEEFKPDIIQSQLYHPNILNCMLKKRFPKTRCILAEHSGGLIKNPLRRWWMKRVFKRADKIVVISKLAEKKIKSLGLINTHYIPNGIDLKRYKRGKKGKRTIMTTVGRLEEIKGHIYLIEAMDLLSAKDHQLRIIGDGSLKNKLEAQVLVRGLDRNIIFTGERDDVPKHLSQSSIFILPSLYEDQPLALIEAMASGNAIIASRTGGIPEIISDKEAILVEPGNAEALKKAMQKLLKDKKTLKRYGELARKLSKRYDIERCAEEYKELYII